MLVAIRLDLSSGSLRLPPVPRAGRMPKLPTAVRKLGPNGRPAYRALRALSPREGEPCGVPGCKDLRVTEECCYRHSLNKSSPNFLPNDGLIDWQAIEVAAQGLREVSLTWVETVIAAGMILAEGGGVREVERRMHVFLKSSSERLAEARAIADAIREERDAS